MSSGFRTCLSLFVFVLSTAVLIGCNGKNSPAKTPDEKSPTPEPVANNKKSPKQPEQKKPARPAVKLKPYDHPKTVELKDVTPKELQAFIAKQKGQVVLVDYWAMWCEPCKAILPHTIALGRQHAKNGLIVVTMALDSLDNREAATKFLKSKDARVVNFIASEKLDPDMLMELFEVEGTLPHYGLYGPDGKRIQTLKPGDTEKAEDFRSRLDAAVMGALGL